MDQNVSVAIGDELVWLPSAKRKERLRVRVVELTAKRIAIRVVGHGWNTSKTYYVTKPCLGKLYKLRHRGNGEVKTFVTLREYQETLQSSPYWTSV